MVTRQRPTQSILWVRSGVFLRYHGNIIGKSLKVLLAWQAAGIFTRVARLTIHRNKFIVFKRQTHNSNPGSSKREVCRLPWSFEECPEKLIRWRQVIGCRIPHLELIVWRCIDNCPFTSTINMADLNAFNVRQKYRPFRILVIGRANAGKTTLLKRVFNTTEDPGIYNELGTNLVRFLSSRERNDTLTVPSPTSWNQPQR